MFHLVTERTLQDVIAPIDKRLREIEAALFDHECKFSENGPQYMREGVVNGLRDVRFDLARLIARLSIDMDVPRDVCSGELLELVKSQEMCILKNRESVDAALYRDLPDECKNGHKKGGKR